MLTALPRCRGCGHAATQVHHNRYRMTDLTGECTDHLIPVCSTCHKTAEFNKRGEKIGPQRATEKLDTHRQEQQKIWRRQDAKQAWEHFFATLEQVRVYLGMEENEEARRLVEALDDARQALPPRRQPKLRKKKRPLVLK